MKSVATAGAVLCVLSLAACQPEPAPRASATPQQSTFLSDAGDPCMPERRALEQNGAPVAGTFDGALDLAYAVGGVLESLRKTGRASGTITADGVTLAGGYIEALRRENGTVLAMLDNANRDIEEENRRIDALLAAFGQLRACRRAGAAAIREDYQAGKVSRADAAAGMIQLRGALRQDIARTRELADQVSRNTQTFAEVYNDVAEDNDAEALELGPYRRENFDRGQPSAKLVRKRKPRKRASPKGSLRAEPETTRSLKPKVREMQDQLLTNVRKRDAIINQVEVAEAETEELDLARAPSGTRRVIPS